MPHDWRARLREACSEWPRYWQERRERDALLSETDHRLIVASLRRIEESRELLQKVSGLLKD